MKLRHPRAKYFFAIAFFALFTLAAVTETFAQGKIAFASDRDGNAEIYVMNSDGTGQNRLTFNTAGDNRPSFSPGGAQIAFDSDRDGNLEIYVMDSNGNNQTRLTNNSVFDADPCFSPDGTKIAFSSNRDGNAEIYVMEANGSNPIRLTNNSSSDTQPAFSSDGTKIVFARDADVWVMNSDGSNQTQLTFTPGLDIDPATSPDGSKVVFRANRGTPVADEDVYIMNADGSNQQQLTTTVGPDTEPGFSPDGAKIAFVSVRDGNSEIYVMNSQGGSPMRLTNNSALDVSPTWTDGSLFPPELSNVTVSPDLFLEGGSTTLSGNISSVVQGLNFTLTVDWGDGSSPQMFNYPAGTTSFSETHQYLDDLPFGTIINLSLSNMNGGDDAYVGILGVANVAPSLTLSVPTPVVVLGNTTFVTGTVTDPGALDSHTVAVDWGDGSQATSINLAAGETNFSTNHTYAVIGAYSIIVSADDDDDGVATPVNRLVGVVPPPTLGKIAFTSNFAGNNNIYLMSSNGTGQVPLTTNVASDAYPNLSHDGSKIAFVSDRDGNSEIYVMNSAGKFQTRLTNNAAVDTTPVFSPDGSKIAFASNRDGNYEIYIMNADGSGQTRLTTSALDDGQPTFSPDGMKVFFVRLASNQTDSHIWSMDLNGANQTALTSGSFVLNGQPNFSPDGQKIVFSSVRPLSGFTEPEIFVMDANGANQLRLTTAAGYDLEPVFSPDGAKIAFRSERTGSAEIFIMDANGANQQRITFDGAGVSNFAPSWASVSLVTADMPDDLAAEQGAVLTVPIIVSDTTGKGIISYDLTLNYDPNVLEPLATPLDKTSTLSSAFEVNSGMTIPGKLDISGFGTVPLTGAGTMLYVKFNVIGTPPTASDLTLSPFVFNEGIPFVDVLPGHVFVQGTISGTVSYGTSPAPIGVPDVMLFAAGTPNTSTTTAVDGTYRLGGFGPGAYTVTPSKTGDIGGISSFDASLVSLFRVGATVLTANQQAAADASGDGTVTSFDAALIAQYVVGLPNTAQTGSWKFMPPSRSYPTVDNKTGENYTAILIGEVSGNWTSAITGLSGGVKTLERSGSAVLGDSSQSQFARIPAGSVTASLPTLKAVMNQTVTVPVGIKISGIIPPIQAYQFDLVYDPSVIQPETTPADLSGSLSDGLSVVTNVVQPGRLRLAVYGTNSIVSTGILLNLKFRVVGRNGANSTLAFSTLMFNEGNPAGDGKSGKISVTRR